MASPTEIGNTYNWMEAMPDLIKPPDITCAFFNGDYSLSLREAQRAKHEFILGSLFPNQTREGDDSLNFMDIGSGWGGVAQGCKRQRFRC